MVPGLVPAGRKSSFKKEDGGVDITSARLCRCLCVEGNWEPWCEGSNVSLSDCSPTPAQHFHPTGHKGRLKLIQTRTQQPHTVPYMMEEGKGREYIEICPLIVFNATLHLPEGLKVLIDGGSGLPTQSLTGQALIGQYNGGDVNSSLRVPFLVQSNRKALLNGRERKKGAGL